MDWGERLALSIKKQSLPQERPLDFRQLDAAHTGAVVTQATNVKECSILAVGSGEVGDIIRQFRFGRPRSGETTKRKLVPCLNQCLHSLFISI